ncbi:HMA2 domain-containing protein [Halobacillus faecis]
MQATFSIVHDIPGRLRLIIPALYDKRDYDQIQDMFTSIKGIESVRIEPTIQSMTISYVKELINRKVILRFISLFFKQTRFDPLDNIMVNIAPAQRKDFLRSLVTGFLILIAYLNNKPGKVPGMLDYAVVISTAYTVLSHGENKFRHPDVITGIVSMLSIGAGNILQVAMVTWAVNVIELLNDASKSKLLL